VGTDFFAIFIPFHRIKALGDASQEHFIIDRGVEQAAHIVPKNKNGTDDPRNGLTLCRAHHWAFDAGLFTPSNEFMGWHQKSALSRLRLSAADFESADTFNALKVASSRWRH
jgi:hypothetical protein